MLLRLSVVRWAIWEYCTVRSGKIGIRRMVVISRSYITCNSYWCAKQIRFSGISKISRTKGMEKLSARSKRSRRTREPTCVRISRRGLLLTRPSRDYAYPSRLHHAKRLQFARSYRRCVRMQPLSRDLAGFLQAGLT